MNYYTDRFQGALKRHLHIARDAGKHLMKVGKSGSSVVISHEVEIVDGGDAHIKTRIHLLPVRTMYNTGGELIGDEVLGYEMEEDVGA
jgi:uncharacterized protein YxjI